MTDGVVIRPLSEADLPLVRDLAHRIWPRCYAALLMPAQIETMLARIYSFDNLRAEMAAGHCYWLAEGDAPLGFCSAYRDGDRMWLKKLYVLPACQGMGAGQQLIAAATAHFSGVREVRLYVQRDNEKAKAFYVRRGFSYVGEQRVDMGGYSVVDMVYAKPVDP